MTKSLTENTWVYTDKGIENVHWCSVDGVDELVTPKGKVLSPVPTYEEYQKLKEQLAEADKTIKEIKQQIDESNMVILSLPAEKLSTCMIACEYLKKWGVK